MKDLTYNGAYYIGLEGDEAPDPRSVQLNGQTYEVGAKFTHLGNPTKKRVLFEMQTGWHLVFQGWFGNYLLFTTWHETRFPHLKPIKKGQQLGLFEEPVNGIYYGFGYVDDSCLLLPSRAGCRDIRF